MGSYCSYNYCALNCCNYYGNCPTLTGSILQTQCYYYYSDMWWIYYVIGAGIFLLFVIIGLIAFCIRRNRIRRAANQNMVVI